MTAYASLTATTHMTFAYRMLVPYLPVLVILLLRVCPTRPANGATSRFAISCGVVVVVAQLLLLVVIDRWSLNPGVIGEYRKLSRREYVQFMQTLDKQASAIQALAEGDAPSDLSLVQIDRSQSAPRRLDQRQPLNIIDRLESNRVSKIRACRVGLAQGHSGGIRV